MPSRKAPPPCPRPLKTSPPSKVTALGRSYPFRQPSTRLPNASTPQYAVPPQRPRTQALQPDPGLPGRLTPSAGRPLPPAAPPPSDNGARLPDASLSRSNTLAPPRPMPRLRPQASSPPLSFPQLAQDPAERCSPALTIRDSCWTCHCSCRRRHRRPCCCSRRPDSPRHG